MMNSEQTGKQSLLVLIVDDVPDNLKNIQRESVVISVEFKEKVEAELFRNIDGVLSVKTKDNFILIEADKQIDVRADIFKFATEKGLTLLGMNQESSTMEDVFRQLTQNK